jgi:hypothetical protein
MLVTMLAVSGSRDLCCSQLLLSAMPCPVWVLSLAAAGTIVYMPQELLVSGRMTTATDIYSFGLMSEWAELAGTNLDQ